MSEQFVSVPVPVEHVARVYKLLVDLANGTPKPESMGVVQPVGDFEQVAPHISEKCIWPIETVHRAVIESNQGQRNFLKYLAERPGQVLTTQQIAEGLGVQRKDIAGPLSGLSRRMNNRYKFPKWFFPVYWDGKQCSYLMEEREATAILEALA